MTTMNIVHNVNKHILDGFTFLSTQIALTFLLSLLTVLVISPSGQLTAIELLMPLFLVFLVAIPLSIKWVRYINTFPKLGARLLVRSLTTAVAVVPFILFS